MTNDDLKLLVRDVIASLPDSLSSREIACVLANIASVYAPTPDDAIGHLAIAVATITAGEKI